MKEDVSSMDLYSVHHARTKKRQHTYMLMGSLFFVFKPTVGLVVCALPVSSLLWQSVPHAAIVI